MTSPVLSAAKERTTSLLLQWMTPTPTDGIAGPASVYYPGVMEQVAANRGDIHHVDGYAQSPAANRIAGLVAQERAVDIGHGVDITAGQGTWHACLVAHCRQLAHFRGPSVVEFGHRSASRCDWPRPAVTVRHQPSLTSNVGSHACPEACPDARPDEGRKERICRGSSPRPTLMP